MSFTDAIAEALANSKPPPPNELTTCEWIIYPLLLAAGYQRRDIISRFADNNGQFPDYSILPDSSYNWFLEAKSWNSTPEDRHAQQALNYANQNGKRWVVLSTGQEWRLYDNRIEGVASDKLVARVFLQNTDATEQFLKAISKSSVTTGGLEKFATETRLNMVLQEQLEDEGSEVIRSLHSVIKRQPGLGSASRQDIVSFFRRSAPGQIESVRTKTVASPISGATSLSPDATAALSLVALRENAATYVTGRQPSEVIFPDNQSVLVPYWSEVARAVITWLTTQGKLPVLPFQGRQTGRILFLNETPEHTDGPMRRATKVEGNGRSVYVDMNRSGADFVNRLCEVCDAVGVSPSSIMISLKAVPDI